jgi:hypothetical protein
MVLLTNVMKIRRFALKVTIEADKGTYGHVGMKLPHAYPIKGRLIKDQKRLSTLDN